jgi:hypothetical protein
MDITITITDEQAKLLQEHAIRNMPPGTPTDPQRFIEYVIHSTCNNLKREKIQAEMDTLTPDELEQALNVYKTIKQP